MTKSTSTSNHHHTNRAPKRSIPVELFVQGQTPQDALCGQGPFTLIDATANPMENVLADLQNFGDCAVRFTFNRENAAPVIVTLQSGEPETFKTIPGRVTFITVQCSGGGTICGAFVGASFTKCVSCKS